MATTLDLFVATSRPIGDLVRELEVILGATFAPSGDDDDPWFWTWLDPVAIHVAGHTFDNDRDVRFEDYDHWISMRAVAFAVERRHAWRCARVAVRLYRELKARRYGLMLVEGVEAKLREYRP